MEKQILVDSLIEVLKSNAKCGDYTVLDNILMRIPCSDLISAMPEEIQPEFKDVQEDEHQPQILFDWLKGLGYRFNHFGFWNANDVQLSLDRYNDAYHDARTLTKEEMEDLLDDVLVDVLEDVNEGVIEDINSSIDGRLEDYFREKDEE